MSANHRTWLIVSIVLVGGAILGAILFADLWDTDRPTPSEPIGASAPPEPPLSSSQPTLKGTDWQGTFRRLEQPDAGGAALPEASMRIRGALVGGPEQPKGLRVYIVTKTAPEVIVVHDEEIPGREFDVSFLVDRAGGAQTVSVGLTGQGLQRQTRDVEVRAGATEEMEFQWTNGTGLSGRVLTVDGRPVVGLRLYATSTHLATLVVSRASYRSAQEEARVPSGGAVFDNTGVTRSDGTFEIEGLGPGQYTLVCEPGPLMLKDVQRYDAGTTGIEIQALPALLLRCTVEDSDAGGPIKSGPIKRLSSTIQVQPLGDGELQYAIGAGGREGLLEVSWPARGSEIERGFGFSLTVDAPGYGTRTQILEWMAGQNEKEIHLTLQRLATGTVMLGIVDADGAPMTRKVEVALVHSNRRDMGVRGISADLIAPGQYRAKIPAGRWFLRVYPSGVFGSMISFVQEVEVAPSGQTSTRGAFGPFGFVRVDRDCQLLIEGSLRDYEHIHSCVEVAGGEPLLIPTGRWTIKVAKEDDPGQTVVVWPGETVTIGE